MSTLLLPRIDRDTRLVIAAAAVRALDYGFLSVFIGIYLSLLEFTAFQAGLVFSGLMAGGALSNAVASWKGDTIGRRRMLVAMSALMVLGGAMLPMTTSVAMLVVVGLFAMTTAAGGDRTAFISLDTAILAQTVDARQRTTVFSWYNLLGVIAKALSALLIGVPALLQSQLGMGELASFKVMFIVYAVVAMGGIALYGALSPAVERPEPEPSAGPEAENPTESRREARGIILKMSALFSLDAMGGGFMTRGFLSFWFVSRFDMDLYAVTGVFFGAQVMNAISVWAAAPVSHRIGLINTMAFTQALSNVLMIAVAFAGNLWAAVALFLVKELSNDMDIPARQSYTMAIVPRESQTSMASVTNLGRNITQTISPTIAGLVAQVTFLGAPLVMGSVIKLVYNGMLYSTFRGVKAPEERERADRAAQLTGEMAGDPTSHESDGTA